MSLITNKEEYLLFRQQWKERYKQISEDIRDVKRDIKKIAQSYALDPKYPNSRIYSPSSDLVTATKYKWAEKLKVDLTTTRFYFWPEAQREKLRKEATSMLETLAKEKAAAKERYLKSRLP